MKVLVVSDEPDKRIWDYYKPGMLDSYELILSAGDLPPQYLSYIVTLARCPVFYVHGNHDDCYKETPPEGRVCIDGEVVEYKGLRIMGLGGSVRYKPGIHQYTEAQMASRIRKMKRRIAKHKGFDVLLAHSPALGLGDGEDNAHRGFECFLSLLDKYEPSYFFYGHQHTCYGRNIKREMLYKRTRLFNATNTIEVDIDFTKIK